MRLLKKSADHLKEIFVLLKQEYHLNGKLTELVAYQDENYLMVCTDGKKYIVKISMFPEERELVLAQNDILKALSGEAYPKPVETIHGNYHVDIQVNDFLALLRVFPYFEGKFLAETEAAPAFFSEFGEFIAILDTELSLIKNTVLQCQGHDWDLAGFQKQKPLADFIADTELKRLVLFFFMKHHEEVTPVYSNLPKSIIHGDANDWNIIVKSLDTKGLSLATGVKALIDFGDMVYSARVHEIAIALAYTLSKVNDKIKAASLFIKAYHDKNPLRETEIRVLYYMIAARLCIIIVNAAKKLHEQPDSKYHQVSADAARNLLKNWIMINPSHFENELLIACGNTDSG